MKKKQFVKSFKPTSFGAHLPKFSSRAKRIGGKKAGGEVDTEKEMTRKGYQIPPGTRVIDNTEEPRLDELRRLQRKNQPTKENKMAAGGKPKKMFGGDRVGLGNRPMQRPPLPPQASPTAMASRPPMPTQGGSMQRPSLPPQAMGTRPPLPPQAAQAAIAARANRPPMPAMKRGGAVKKKAAGGGVKSRGMGCEARGKTRGKMC